MVPTGGHSRFNVPLRRHLVSFHVSQPSANQERSEVRLGRCLDSVATVARASTQRSTDL